jgi:hypothetical protein
LHFGPVIVGEIGYIKRAIVFNGDVMNTAARLEELSRGVEGGFLASRAAMEQFRSALPVKVRNLGRLPIRGRLDGIDVVGLDIPAAQAAAAVCALADLGACIRPQGASDLLRPHDMASKQRWPWELFWQLPD